MAKDSTRVSVKSYLLPYLQSVGEAIGTDDLTEVVNHLIVCQKLGCFGTPQQQTTQPVSAVQPMQSANNSTALNDNDLADSLSGLLAA
jgi:hypothetical protein